MKQLYICEKCGKSFTEYEEAWKCEESHIDRIETWDMPDMIPKEENIYKEGSRFPEKLHITFKSYNDDGPVLEVIRYKLDKKIEDISKTETEKAQEKHRIQQEEWETRKKAKEEAAAEN